MLKKTVQKDHGQKGDPKVSKNYRKLKLLGHGLWILEASWIKEMKSWMAMNNTVLDLQKKGCNGRIFAIECVTKSKLRVAFFLFFYKDCGRVQRKLLNLNLRKRGDSES